MRRFWHWLVDRWQLYWEPRRFIRIRLGIPGLGITTEVYDIKNPSDTEAFSRNSSPPYMVMNTTFVSRRFYDQVWQARNPNGRKSWRRSPATKRSDQP